MALPPNVESVETREDFIEFVRGLSEADPEGWENPTARRFLEALAAWAEDTQDAQEPSWRSFALMLTAATGYE